MCQLNPLRVCLPAVTNMFAAITRYSTREFLLSGYKALWNKSMTNEGNFTRLLAGSTSSCSVTPSSSGTTGTCCQWWGVQLAATQCPLTQTLWIPSSLLIHIFWKGTEVMSISINLSTGIIVYWHFISLLILQQLWKTHRANLPGVGGAIRLCDRCAQKGSQKGKPDLHSQWPQRGFGYLKYWFFFPIVIYIWVKRLFEQEKMIG